MASNGYTYSQAKLIQWGIPFSSILKRRILLLISSALTSHYHLTYKELSKMGSVLDVGTGLGTPIKILRKCGLRTKIIGIDIHRSYLINIQNKNKRKLYDEVIIADAAYLPFREKSFDSIICFQVIEHLTHRAGLKMLREFHRVVKKNMLITTPVGFIEAIVDPSNPSQKHESGWLPIDFKRLGFSVKGYGGPRVKSVHSKIFPFVILLGIILLPIFYHFPLFAYHMWCVKRIGE